MSKTYLIRRSPRWRLKPMLARYWYAVVGHDRYTALMASGGLVYPEDAR